ncbi:MAG: VWA domain-containing protein [Treponema sp.]|nr:VWA domain-containing protein [Treponema sp.]
MKFSKKIIFFIFLLTNAILVFTQNLQITQKDLRLEKDAVSGYHLYIKKIEDIESVLLTETMKDTTGVATNYAYRAQEYNIINGDEKRILNGVFLESEYSKYSLVDSTPQDDNYFGKAFHIYIPQNLVWGYEWGRNGMVEISMGTFVNIRAFEKPYADYEGKFLDNPFMFNFIPVNPVLTDDYSKIAVESFENIAKKNKGNIIYSKGPETIVDDIIKSLKEISEKKRVDVVFAIDSTGSMKDDIEILRRDLKARLETELLNFDNIRLGLLLYRDYGDNYNYKNLPVKFNDFTNDIDKFFEALNGFKIYGTEGGDVPEAVYEALYAAMNFYKWDMKASRKIILIGDAEPHPKPRGLKIKCTKESINAQAQSMGIKIDTIITPDEKTKKR